MRLAAVDALRGVAILGVLLYHLFGRFTDPGGTWQVAVEQGWLGVPLFFVLSGFVLALPYAVGRRRLDSPSDALEFYRRRARRLLPLYYLSLLAGFVFVSHPDPLDPLFPRDLLLYATATFVYVPDRYYPPPNWVLWSLGIEIGFSLLFPLLLAALRRFGPAAFFCASAALALLVRLAGEAHYGGSFNPQLDPIKDSVLGRLDEFAAGMALAFAAARRRPRGKTALLLLAGGLVLFGAGAFGHDRLQAGRIARSALPWLYLPVTLGAAVLLAGLLGLAGRPLRLLSPAPLQLFGRACYSLYVWHGIVLLHLVTRPEHYAPLPLFLVLLVLFALVGLSYRYVEFGHVRDAKALFAPSWETLATATARSDGGRGS